MDGVRHCRVWEYGDVSEPILHGGILESVHCSHHQSSGGHGFPGVLLAAVG